MLVDGYIKPKELAREWHIHPATVIRLFRDEPDVLKFGLPGRRILRIPRAAIERVRQRLSDGQQPGDGERASA